jgi:hypothetical protein
MFRQNKKSLLSNLWHERRLLIFLEIYPQISRDANRNLQTDSWKEAKFSSFIRFTFSIFKLVARPNWILPLLVNDWESFSDVCRWYLISLVVSETPHFVVPMPSNSPPSHLGCVYPEIQFLFSLLPIRPGPSLISPIWWRSGLISQKRIIFNLSLSLLNTNFSEFLNSFQIYIF